jgi:RNA polymerase sigma-70 factor (family 1)
MPTNCTTDAELWQAIRNDDEHAFNQLFNRYWVKLYKAAYSKLQEGDVCAEIVHDIFLRLWQRRKELEIEHFAGYLLMAVRFQVYSRYKATKSPVLYKEAIDEKDQEYTWNKGDLRLQEHELQQTLQFYINQLPKRCIEIFTLSRVNHLSNHEIAQRLGISKKSVENQLTMALKHLRTAYRELTVLVVLLGTLK